MKFAVGYQETDTGEPFSAIVRDYREAVAEVYFPWPGCASGRAALGKVDGAIDWDAQSRLERELAEIRSMNVSLDLLFNANCYGGEAISSAFRNRIVSILDHLDAAGLLPEIVTTTSPFVAHVVKNEYPGIEIRASVNLRIDSTLAMEYLADLFDSFYLRRDLQRNLARVRTFHQWCTRHGKKLLLLANSGCLLNCPAQTFHDNLVAHDSEVDGRRNERYLPHLCWRLYRDRNHFIEFLRSTWLRPEDLCAYEPWFPVVKLATRQHSHPRMVIGAYASGHFRGNLLDLMEPSFSAAFAPYLIDNERFPDNWRESMICDDPANCTHCGRCEQLLKRVLKKFDESPNRTLE